MTMRPTWRFLVAAALALPVTASGQGNAPTLTLDAPRFTTGDLELHRVSGAGLLPDGRIAIANGGTFNVIIVNRNGTIERRFWHRLSRLSTIC